MTRRKSAPGRICSRLNRLSMPSLHEEKQHEIRQTSSSRDCDCNETPTLHSILTRPIRSVINKKQDSHLAAAVTSKLEARNFRAAIRLLCSDDNPTPNNEVTLEAHKSKHHQDHLTVNLAVNFLEMRGFSHCQYLWKL